MSIKKEVEAGQKQVEAGQKQAEEVNAKMEDLGKRISDGLRSAFPTNEAISSAVAYDQMVTAAWNVRAGMPDSLFIELDRGEEEPNMVIKRDAFGIIPADTWDYFESIGEVETEQEYFKRTGNSFVARTIYKEAPVDMVNHPPHYTNTSIECIDNMILIFGLDETAVHCAATCYKYLSRAELKDTYEENLAKAKWYYNKALELFHESGEYVPDYMNNLSRLHKRMKDGKKN